MLWGLLAPMAIRAIKVPIGNSTAERNFAGYSAWANRFYNFNKFQCYKIAINFDGYFNKFQ